MNHEEVKQFCETQGLMALPAPGPLTPKKVEGYVFRKSLVIDMVGFFLMQPYGVSALRLNGPQGCGKTSLVQQFHAALNYPLIIPSTHGQTELDDLLGKVVPTQDGWRRVPGPLQRAAEKGISIFIDEYNAMPSSTISSLNRAAEAGRIDIPESGQVIEFQEGFRLFAACNPNDPSLGFHGRNAEDVSNLDRFWIINTGYPDPDDEVPLVERILSDAFEQDTANRFAASMVEVAGRIRAQYMGNSDEANALSVTMSTRSLLRWAAGIITFAEAPNAPRYSLERSLLGAADAETREAIGEILDDVFGTLAA